MVESKTLFQTLPPQPAVIEQQQYQTFGYNCHSPLSIQYIDKEERCNYQSDNLKVHKPIDWDSLVHPLKMSYKGSRGSIVKSTIKVRCGLWYYIQLPEFPETEVPVHVPTSTCQAMIQDGIYRTPDSTEVKLDCTKENIISFKLGGEIHATDSKVIYCQGADRKLKSGIVENTIVLKQVK